MKIGRYFDFKNTRFKHADWKNAVNNSNVTMMGGLDGTSLDIESKIKKEKEKLCKEKDLINFI